jgi:acetylornithine deacetylase
LRAIEFADDPVLGRTHYTVGLIAGGVAPNVVSSAAEAEVMFRTVGDADHVRAAMSGLESTVSIEQVLEVPPVKMATVEGFETAVFPYTTDIPFLNNWGQPLLFGPGSIHVAHTAEEFIDIDELNSAVDGYVRIVRELLTR